MWSLLKRTTLTQWIFIGMGVGILVGWLAPEFAVKLKPLSTIFLRMIKSIVVPIIFGTLVVGIAGHGDDLKRIGRLAVKAIAYFWLMTSVALAIGLIAGNLVRPGVGVILPPPDPGQQVKAAPTTLSGFLEHVVPRSFFEAAADNEVLQVVFWSIAVRDRADAGEGPPQGSDAAVRRGDHGGDVQVRRDHHEVRADRHRGGHGGHGEPLRASACWATSPSSS